MDRKTSRVEFNVDYNFDLYAWYYFNGYDCVIRVLLVRHTKQINKYQHQLVVCIESRPGWDRQHLGRPRVFKSSGGGALFCEPSGGGEWVCKPTVHRIDWARRSPNVASDKLLIDVVDKNKTMRFRPFSSLSSQHELRWQRRTKWNTLVVDK